MQYYFYKLNSGVDVCNSLNQLHRDTDSTAFLISAVGDLSKVSFKCPLNQEPVILEKKLEIISLSGYIKSTDSHLHISVSDEACTLFGGHLLPGSHVLKSLEILLGVIPNLKYQSINIINQQSKKVDIYVLPGCPWSKRAMKILDSYQIKYNYHVITNDEEFQIVSNKTSIKTFPQIFINKEFIGGYSELSNLSSNGNLINLIR